MEGMVKCESCVTQFDVELLQYKDETEKFVCPECGSAKFKSLIEVEGVTASMPAASAGSPLMQEMVTVMQKYLAGDIESVSYKHRFQNFVSRYESGER